MSKALRADRRELRLVTGRVKGTVDVFFDEHRVWSTQLPRERTRRGVCRVPWPEALKPYLHGSSTVAVRTSAKGEELAAGDVAEADTAAAVAAGSAAECAAVAAAEDAAAATRKTWPECATRCTM